MLVETALEMCPGVVYVDVSPGMTKEAIIDNVLTAITGRKWYPYSKAAAAMRIEWWHSWLTPIKVVLNCGERLRDSPRDYADVAGAARDLAKNFKFKVILDASDNSAPGSLLETMREHVLRLDPLDRATLEGIPEFSALVKGLNTTRLHGSSVATLGDAVWHVFGGVPQAYLYLDNAWKEKNCDIKALRSITIRVVASRIGKALSNIEHFVGKDEAAARILAKFKDPEINFVLEKELVSAGVVRPSPDKVLRLAEFEYEEGKPFVKGITGKQVLVPASPTVGFVLRNGLGDPPSPEDLAAILLPLLSQANAPVPNVFRPTTPEPEMK